MSINLLEIAESTLLPVLQSKAGELFGFSQEQGKSALSSILPTLLGGVLNKASTHSGAAALYKAVSDASVNSHVGSNLMSVLGQTDGTTKLFGQGNQILSFLFGDKTAGLGEHVAKLADTPVAGTKNLLALAAPVVFGLLKNQIVSNKMSPHAFSTLLSSQAVYLEKSLPEQVLEWLGWGSLTGFVSTISHKLTSTLGSLSDIFDGDDKSKALTSNQPTKKSSSLWKWLVPLALLALAALLFKSCQKESEEPQPAPAPEASTAPATPATAEASTDSTLKLTFNNGKAAMSATVASDAEKAALLKELEATYGKDNFTADIKVDASTKPASWLSKLADLLKLSKVPGAELNIKGADITLSGALADPKLGLLDKVKSLFGTDANVIASAFNAENAIADATSKFDEAIKALTASGKCDADALAKALNLYVVNFASASSSIPAKDVAELKTAVPAVATCAKAGVKIEVGGHTDNQGKADSNMKLSTARASAVKALFTAAGVPDANISVKGYGDTQPIADNNTQEGRFQNRRISYTKQ